MSNSPIDSFLIQLDNAICVHGLPEEVVAMVFALYSRSTTGIRDTLIKMVDQGNLELPESLSDTSEKVRKFHERITIGYGHKSVADHAVVHWAVEGVSALLERDFLKARLLAATSQSTRYVDFKEKGFVVPTDWPRDHVSEYVDHCNELIHVYAMLIPIATEAVRETVPWSDDLGWKTHSGWELATSKRALDLVRDLLPMSIRTNFGVSMSATGLREFLDKRQSGYGTEDKPLEEYQQVSLNLRSVCAAAVPSLLPTQPRTIPRDPPIKHSYFAGNRVYQSMSVSIIKKPDWAEIGKILGQYPYDLMKRWTHDRCRHMVPDRQAELPRYVITGRMPIAIYRDLGRHRIMTQMNSLINPGNGYGRDPMFSVSTSSSVMRLLRNEHAGALSFADERLERWSSVVNPEVLQYACPMATMVDFVWEVSLRQIVHILGLRTVPQGHPGYRLWVQHLAKAINDVDPIARELVNSVTNYEYVTIGRPG